jgi:hypothetical protein
MLWLAAAAAAVMPQCTGVPAVNQLLHWQCTGVLAAGNSSSDAAMQAMQQEVVVPQADELAGDTHPHLTIGPTATGWQ